MRRSAGHLAAQAALRAKQFMRRNKGTRFPDPGRGTKRFCHTCGGDHAGNCRLVSTTHGTRCRPEILEAVERRFQAKLTAATT